MEKIYMVIVEIPKCAVDEATVVLFREREKAERWKEIFLENIRKYHPEPGFEEKYRIRIEQQMV